MKSFLFIIAVIVAFCSSIFSQTEKVEKITTAELVTKHLASIGSTEALRSVKSRVLIGNGVIDSKIGLATKLSGLAQFAAEGDKVLFAMIFDSSSYPYEKAGYDGQDLFIGFPTGGNRSILGDFFKSHEAIFKKGLFGGTLSSGWAFLDLPSNKGKIEYAGTENIDNRRLYKIRYNSAGALTTFLYFEPDTFRHVLTEYEFIATPRMGASSIENARQKQRRFKFTERFADFKTEGQLMLPHTYIMRLMIQEETTRSLEWRMKFSQFVFNEPLDAKLFRVS